MSKPKWTPGPWEAHTFIVMAGRDLITHTGGSLPRNRFCESEANARLIASAPELYEAAECVVAGLLARIDNAPLNNVPVFHGLVELRTALAKARGETQ